MNKKIVVSFLFLLVLQMGFANEHQSKFEKATAAYDSSNFTTSISIYESLLDENIISSDLHFNLGNAYFKQNRIPKAILNYEKALKINPNNEDAAYNLKLANSKTIDKIESIPELFLYRWWKTIFNLFDSETWAILSVSFLFGSALLSSLYFFPKLILLKKIGFYSTTLFLFLSLTSWLMAHKQKSYLSEINHAIVIEPTVNISSSPSKGSSILFVLHEGTKVNVVNQTDEWLEISLPNGNKGWVKHELVEGV